MLIDYEVEAWEAYLTFGFFWILIIMAVSADMYRRNIIKRKEEERIGNLDEMTQDEKENMKRVKKSHLPTHAFPKDTPPMTSITLCFLLRKEKESKILRFSRNKKK